MKTVLSQRNIIKQNYLLNNSSYKLSALSLDIVMGLITEVKNEDKDFNIYEFYIKDIEKKFDKQIDERTLHKVAEELLSSTITVKKDKDFLKMNWVSSFEYLNSQRKFEISFDPKLKPYLLELKENFVLGYFSEIIKIRSEYSKRIYMLLRQRVNIGQWTINLDELQNLLMVPNSYKRYKEFKRSVLKTAEKQIQENSSLGFTIEEIKEGRKTTKLKFIISDTSTKQKVKLNKQSKSNNTGLKALENWYSEDNVTINEGVNFE